MKRMLAFVALILAGAAGSAQATVIDFEDLAVPPGTITNGADLISRGFLFDTLADHSHLANRNVLADNGSTYMGIDDVAGENPVTFSQVGGAPFKLTSFDVSEWVEADLHAKQVEVTGHLFGGGTVVALLTLDGIADGPGGLADFQTFTFGKAWGSLSSVTLKGVGSTFGGDYVAFDDIVVDRASVPEPGTLILFGIGSAFALSRRRRR